MHSQSNPNVSVDCVVFGFDGADLKVLLVEREGRDNLNIADDTLVLPGDLQPQLLECSKILQAFKKYF